MMTPTLVPISISFNINAGLQRCIRRSPASRSPHRSSARPDAARYFQPAHDGFGCTRSSGVPTSQVPLLPSYEAMQCLAPGCFCDTPRTITRRKALPHHRGKG
jgi:hypothetical protein